MTRYQDVIDGPTVLRSGDTLENTTIVVAGPQHGRIIFQPSPAIVVESWPALIRNCTICLAPIGIEVWEIGE